MANIKGIYVNVTTALTSGSGTDDYVYLGVFGKGGGSEFPIDVPKFDDFKVGQHVAYKMGDTPESDGLEINIDPAKRWIVLEKVDYVYLRKQSYKTGKEDDAWKMDAVEVRLHGANNQSRTFHKTGDIWLANEDGLQVWLKEK